LSNYYSHIKLGHFGWTDTIIISKYCITSYAVGGFVLLAGNSSSGKNPDIHRHLAQSIRAWRCAWLG